MLLDVLKSLCAGYSEKALKAHLPLPAKATLMCSFKVLEYLVQYSRLHDLIISILQMVIYSCVRQCAGEQKSAVCLNQDESAE